MSVSLHLNGQQVKGHDLQISCNFQLASEDVSGNTSQTTTVETGDKAKSISVSLRVKFTDQADLSNLVALAEAKDASGNRVIYAILERTANAMNIRQVKFDSSMRVTEDSSLERWNVSFELVEYNSVPQKKEDRLVAVAKPVTVQKSPGKVVTAKDTVAATIPATVTPAPEQPKELTGIEKVLKVLDTAAQ